MGVIVGSALLSLPNRNKSDTSVVPVLTDCRLPSDPLSSRVSASYRHCTTLVLVHATELSLDEMILEGRTCSISLV